MITEDQLEQQCLDWFKELGKVRISRSFLPKLTR